MPNRFIARMTVTWFTGRCRGFVHVGLRAVRKTP
jgi:hypothetical protein